MNSKINIKNISLKLADITSNKNSTSETRDKILNNNLIKIKNAKTYKKHLIILLLYDNSLVSYNYLNKTTKVIYNKNEVQSFLINENRTSPLLFVLYNKTIEVLELFSLKSMKFYEIDIKDVNINKSLFSLNSILNFSLFEKYNNHNLEILFTAELYKNENKSELIYTIYYYNKGILLENKKILLKEQDKIIEFIYREPYLVWSSDKYIKIFDLDSKRLLYKKTIESSCNNIDNHIYTSSYFNFNFISKDIIGFLTKDNSYCYIVKLINNNNCNVSYKEIFDSNYYYNSTMYNNLDNLNNNNNKLDTNMHNIYILGYWINELANEVYIIKKDNHARNKYSDISKLDLDTFDLNFFSNLNTKNNINKTIKTPIISSKSFNNIYLSKQVNFYIDYTDIALIIYDKYNCYKINYYCNKNLLLNDIKDLNNYYNTFSKECCIELKNINNKMNNINDIKTLTNYNVYLEYKNKLNIFNTNNFIELISNKNNLLTTSFDERKFIISCLVKNLEFIVTKSNISKLQNIFKLLIDYEIELSKSDDKLLCNNNNNKNLISSSELMFNYIINLLISNNHLEFCYSWINVYFNLLFNNNIDKVIVYFINNNSYSLLESFLYLIEIIHKTRFKDNLNYSFNDDNLSSEYCRFEYKSSDFTNICNINFYDILPCICIDEKTINYLNNLILKIQSKSCEDKDQYYFTLFNLYKSIVHILLLSNNTIKENVIQAIKYINRLELIYFKLHENDKTTNLLKTNTFYMIFKIVKYRNLNEVVVNEELSELLLNNFDNFLLFEIVNTLMTNIYKSINYSIISNINCLNSSSLYNILHNLKFSYDLFKSLFKYLNKINLIYIFDNLIEYTKKGQYMLIYNIEYMLKNTNKNELNEFDIIIDDVHNILYEILILVLESFIKIGNSNLNNYLILNCCSDSQINTLNEYINNKYKIDEINVLTKDSKTEDQSVFYIYIDILFRLNKHIDVINLYVDKKQDPELAIIYIDKLDLIKEKKNDLFDYLEKLILDDHKNENNSNITTKHSILSSIQKYYFVNLFKRNVRIYYIINNNVKNEIVS